jgi:mannosyltransferase
VRRPGIAEGLVGAVATAVWIAGVGGADAWRDEVATIAVSGRAVDEILLLVGHVDAVLASYYLLVHAVAPGDVVGARVVSVVALAAATVLLLPLCRRLGVPAAGLGAAAFLVVCPVAARWAQEARPAALAVLAATAATFALTAALTGGRARWWCWYALAVAVLAYVQLTALLLLPAHAVTVWVCRRDLTRRWAAAASAAVLAAAPLAYLGSRQRDAIAWIARPEASRLEDLPYAMLGTAPIAAVVLGTVVLAAARHPPDPAGRQPGDRPPGVVAVALPWAVVPAAGLWLGGQVTPLYTERYLVFCLPAVALLVGRALAGLRRRHAATALVAVLLLGLPQQVAIRSDGGHREDIGQLLAVVRDQGRPGDAVIFEQQSTRLLAEAFPATFAPLRDVTAGRSGASAGTFGGTWPDRPCRTIPERVDGHARVWVVALHGKRPDYPAAVALSAMHEFSQVSAWRGRPYTLTLLVRGPAAGEAFPCPGPTTTWD